MLGGDVRRPAEISSTLGFFLCQGSLAVRVGDSKTVEPDRRDGYSAHVCATPFATSCDETRPNPEVTMLHEDFHLLYTGTLITIFATLRESFVPTV